MKFNPFFKIVAAALATASVTRAAELNFSPLATALDSTQKSGQDAVTSNPVAFNLYTPDSIQDLRGSGNLLIRVTSGNVTISMPVEKSDSLLPGSFIPVTEGDLELTIP